MKFLSFTVACLMLRGWPASYAKPAFKTVEFDRLLQEPQSFYGKLVRVRGFLLVSLPPRDVGIIALCANENEARNFSRSHRCVGVSLRGSRNVGIKNIKSGSVEITARFVFVPVRGGGQTKILTEIQELEELPEEHGGP
jgi:hypothetical protein